jgi:hypothetical protein
MHHGKEFVARETGRTVELLGYFDVPGDLLPGMCYEALDTAIFVTLWRLLGFTVRD